MTSFIQQIILEAHLYVNDIRGTGIMVKKTAASVFSWVICMFCFSLSGSHSDL